MNSGWKERVYPHLPIFMQNLACGEHGRQQRSLRYSGAFQELLNWLEESQWWPEARIKQHQDDQLKRIIEHAFNTTPYYRRVFDALKLKPTDIKSTDDLYKIPVLTKEDVRIHSEEMVSREFLSASLVRSHTSGTTGKSLQFYLEPRAFQFRWAVWWRHRMRFGVEFNTPHANFTGLTAVPLEQKKPPFWRENRPMNQTVFTMHHIVRSKVRAIARRLNHGSFEYYSGYPSILYVLASLIQDEGLQITAPPKAIFTGAENLYENHRKLISKIFKAPVTDEYGFSEGCGNASRCEEDVYHEDFEYGILECGDAEQIDANSREGKIIATGFGSYAMPFIRYEVGDIGTWNATKCACGRRSTVLTKINGRIEDYVLTPEGRKILRFDYVFKDTQNVRDAQVVQKELGSVCLRIVRRPSYSILDEEILRGEIRRRVSSRLLVEFEYIDEIERESNGKIRAVKSLIRDRSDEKSYSVL